MSNYVFVLDTNRKPLTPCSPGVARSLLKRGRAAVFRRYPFTIILNKEVNTTTETLQIKIDPGSKVTGVALLKNNIVIWAAELTHRGQQIKDALESRRALRRGRRNRHTRYRPARFNNRKRPEGWLAPSLQHRVDTTLSWVNKLMRLCPVGSIAQELVRFDTQLIQTPEISGVAYQQGTLAGYEVREYLLEKWGRKCAYCGVQDVPLEIEHIQPRSKGGSDRVSNLTLACRPCNQAKGNQDVADFLSGKPDLLKRIKSQAKHPLKDAAAVNSTRWALFRALKDTGLPVTTGTGGQTKFNRCRLEFPKEHWIDAACVGQVDLLELATLQPLLIKAAGHGCRQVIHVYGKQKKDAPKLSWPSGPGFQRRNKKGELVRKSAKVKQVKGFRTGDIVSAVVETGKKAGQYVGRVAVRTSGSFNIATQAGTVQGIGHKWCSAVHRGDGYNYAF